MQVIAGIGGLTPSSLLGIIWTGVGFAIFFTCFRTIIKLHIFHRLHADDACVHFALVVLVALGALYNCIVPIMFEFEWINQGKEPIPIDFVSRVDFFLRIQFAIIVMFWTCIWAVKLSFLLWYWKLLAAPVNHMYLWWVVTAFTFAAYIGCWVTQLLSCKPIWHYFHLGACLTKRDIFVSNLSLYYSTAVDIICDLLIMTVPLRLIWGLQIGKRQKCGLGIIFCLAVIIIVFAIVRVIETSASTKHVDPIWLALWSMTEASVAVIVACLPAFQILFNFRSSASQKRRGRMPSTHHQPDGPLYRSPVPARVQRRLSSDIETAGARDADHTPT